MQFIFLIENPILQEHENFKKEIEWLIELVKKLEADKAQLKGAVEFLKKELQY